MTKFVIAEEDDKNIFTNKHIQQFQVLALQQAVEESSAWFRSHLLAMIQACTHHSIIIKSQQ